MQSVFPLSCFNLSSWLSQLFLPFQYLPSISQFLRYQGITRLSAPTLLAAHVPLPLIGESCACPHPFSSPLRLMRTLLVLPSSLFLVVFVCITTSPLPFLSVLCTASTPHYLNFAATLPLRSSALFHWLRPNNSSLLHSPCCHPLLVRTCCSSLTHSLTHSRTHKLSLSLSLSLS